MVKCPACPSTTDYKRISNHWTQSSTCNGPDLSRDQIELTKGLLLGGAMVNRQLKKNPSIVVSSTRREFIEWVRDEYGVFMEDNQIETMDGERLAEGFGHSPENFNDIYRITTYAASAFEPYTDHDFPLSKRALRVWFARKGASWFTHRKGRSGTWSVRISVEQTDNSPEDMVERASKVYDGNWHVFRGRTDSIGLGRQSEVKEFLDLIGPATPGYEWKWDPKQNREDEPLPE